MSPSQLEQILHTQIPVSAAMGLRVRELGPETLTLAAPLALNHNHAGTGFAGSAYSLASLAGWGFLRQLVEREGLAAELLLGEARIRYQRPMGSDLSAHLRLARASQATLLQRLREGHGHRLTLEVSLGDPADPDARFSGTYFAKPRA